jgi:hypothetical protein
VISLLKFVPRTATVFALISGFCGMALTACNVNDTSIGANYYPTVQVSYTDSTVTTAASSVMSGGTAQVTLNLRDTNYNPFISTLMQVSFQADGGTSVGTFSDVINNGDGSYQASFQGVTAGSAISIHAFVNGNEVQSSAPTIQVVSGNYSLSNSALTVSQSSITSNGTTTATLTVKDNSGNQLSSGGLSVAFSASGGTSTGSFGAVTDLGNGTYTAIFTGLLAGTATTIDATIGGSAVTASELVTVTPGAYDVTHSVVTASVSSVNSGGNFIATLTAKDSNGNSNPTGLPGIGSIAFTSTSVGGTGSYGAITAVGSGVYTATFSAATAGSVTLGATISTVAVSNNASVTIGVGSATKLVITSIPSSTIAGSAMSVTVTAEDTAGNTATSYGGSVSITSSDGAAILPGAATLTSGVKTFSVTLKTAGSKTITASDGTFTTSAATVTVNPGAYDVTQSTVVASLSSLNSGSTLTVTLTAKDSSGNTNPTGLPAIGSIAFTSTSVGGTGTYGAVANPSAGVYTATFTAANAGAITLGATISAVAVSNNASVTIGAGGATKLVITSAPPSSTAGSAISITVTAEDAAGNTATTYAGSVSITSSDGAAILPTASTLTSGVKTFSVTLKTAGSKTVTADDGTFTSSAATVTVNPGAYDVTQSTVVASISSVNSGGTLTATLTAKDSSGNSSPTGLPAIVSIAFTSTSVGGTGTYGASTRHENVDLHSAFCGSNDCRIHRRIFQILIFD